MAWARLDDGFPEHPKVLEAGPMGELLFVRALCYCNRQLTDGVIPRSWVERQYGMDGSEVADRLVEVGLWHRHEKGWAVHDYLDYQPNRAQVEALRAVRAEAGSKGGKQKASNLLGRGQDDALANGKQNPTPSRTPSRTRPVVLAEQERSAHADDVPSKPDPASVDASVERTAAPPSESAPWSLLESLCDEVGQDTSVLGKKEQIKQLAAAKRLIADGMSGDDVRRMVRWLTAQSWVTAGVDLTLVEKQLGKWQLAGRPESPKPPPNGRHPAGSTVQERNNRVFAEFEAGLSGRGPPAERDGGVVEAVEVEGRVVR